MILQVKVVRYGRQTVSVDVDTGALLFDRKAGLLGIETISYDRSENRFHFSACCSSRETNLMFGFSTSDCQVSDQSSQGTNDG